ncbi:MAG: hypothetical protein ACKPHU_36475, partial [Planctomycetaceae bacterium]
MKRVPSGDGGITKRCTGVAAGEFSVFRASAGRNPVNAVVRQDSRTRTQCTGTRTRTRKNRIDA